MSSDKNTPRLLGAVFLIVFVASVTALILPQTLFSGSMSDSLVNISNNLTLMRVSILVELVTSIGIVVLAVLLYVVLYKQNKIVALVALGWWLVEAATLAVSKVGTSALIPLSLEYVKAGAPDSSYFQTLGALLYGIDRWGYDIHMVFFSLGGILWYTLFLRSRYIPWLLSVWGIVAVSLALIGTVMVWFDTEIIALVIPNGLFEVAIGLWLVVKGIKSYEPVE